jgi:threonine dehydrogenase-like Zn-dependent dehydrogenase
LEDSLAILAQKKLDVEGMVTHRLSLLQTAEGFRLMADAGKSLKVILEPNKD